MSDPGDDQQAPQRASCEPASNCCETVSRRTFLRWSGLTAATTSLTSGGTLLAGPFSPADVSDHFVPADKKLAASWVAALSAKGERTWYHGAELQTIAMPIGGICAGQLYLTGDGRLAHWDVFNQHDFTGYGQTNYDAQRQPRTPLSQGFAIHVQTGDQSFQRTLDINGFPNLRFCGEYPIGMVQYREPKLPVEIDLDAFSPFIPLGEEDSALPATVLEYRIRNTSTVSAEVTLAGWLENGVCSNSAQAFFGERRNRLVQSDNLTMVLSSAVETKPAAETRPPIVLADFEDTDYGDWQLEGDAFGMQPAGGTLERQQEVSGFQGRGLVNTYLGGDDRLHGKLTSPEFTIERSFLTFLIGGGKVVDKTCIRLIVDGRAVRTAVGKNQERLEWHNWDVRQYAGRSARIEIVDHESGPWGHINVDQIELRDQPRVAVQGSLADQTDFGTMGLAVFAAGQDVIANLSLDADEPREQLVAGLTPPDSEHFADAPFGEPLVGALGQKIHLQPGQETTVSFLVTWCFPHREEQATRRGNNYAKRFADALQVAKYVAEERQRLVAQTRLWHATWYDSTLPHWLLDRLFSTTSTLATSTCQWWGDGRFWAWEGVGCCHGTCTHVWNYEHALARLFPGLERSTRIMQDLNPQAGFVAESGMIRFRGEGWNAWAGDGQAGTVLKAYREHLISPDDRFLRDQWPRVKKALEFLIREDADGNGVLEGSQHNTYDINFFGPNTMVGSLYLAALRAGQVMATTMEDTEFASLSRQLFEAGSRRSAEQLFNGEYFVQQVDLTQHPRDQYGDGCLADQLFGQGWAHQVGLGYVYSQAKVRAALEAIWRYNWAPDVGPQNGAHPPERWFARPGEAGLFTCTWPKSPHLKAGVRYKNEVWTGIEYQVAGHMAWEGMVTEALAICRGIHERYHPAKHNPWNEVECGDHYARGMASYGVFLGLCGFEFDGPAAHLGFAPRISDADFRAAFTAAEAWGTLAQKRTAGTQVNTVEVKWGTLRIATLAFELPAESNMVQAVVTLADRPVPCTPTQEGRRVVIQCESEILAATGDTIRVVLSS